MRRLNAGAVAEALLAPVALAVLTLSTALTALLAVVAGPAFASPLPTMSDIPLQETGVVTYVADGDTFGFLADGTMSAVRVRLLGVNTPEITGFNNAHFDHDFCGGQQARANLLHWLPPGTRVQLRSESALSSNKGRILRYPFAYDPATGAYDIDISQKVAESGLALWFTIDGESDLSYPYRLAIDSASRAGLGIWDPSYCGPLEQPDAQLTLTAAWNPPGADTGNLNGEYVIVRNTGPAAVDLSGWLLRDSSLTSWFYFPPTTVLTPGDYLVAHVGAGTNGTPTQHDFYMGSQVPLFPNTSTTQFLGDGAYLFDTNTALRSSFVYPCVTGCSDPLLGTVVIARVQPRSTAISPARAANQEWVLLTNLSSAPVSLDGYFLSRKISTYPFLPNTTLAPHGSLRVRIGSGTPSATTQFWGQPRPLLANRHDTVELRSPYDMLVDRKAW